jgi:hypothetical protein
VLFRLITFKLTINIIGDDEDDDDEFTMTDQAAISTVKCLCDNLP